MILETRYVLLFVTAYVALLSTSCNKNQERKPIKDVTGYEWGVGALRDATNPYIIPLPAYYQLVLNDDGTFTLNLKSATCTGTYTWTEVDSLSAHVSFTFKKWSDPSEYAGSAQVLRNVLSGANRCYILKGINVPPPITGYTNPTIALDFEGNAGWVYVYR